MRSLLQGEEMHTPFAVRLIATGLLAVAPIGLLLCSTGTRAQAAKPRATKAAAIYEISVYYDSGGGGGRNAGGGEGWTLRSNGTAEHTVSFTPAEMDYELGDNPTITKGTFNPNEFTELLKYLQYSKLLDLKVPKAPSETSMEGRRSVSLVRGGKTKTLSIPDGAPESAATSAYWALSTLVRAITADTDWKNTVGLSVNTGVYGAFKSAAGVTEEERDRFDTPSVVVRDNKGQQVGVLQQTTIGGNYRMLLPPAPTK
jgi:hypothetical protein